MIQGYVNKINIKQLEMVEDRIKDLLCCIDGYDKSMDIEQTLDLLNKTDKWIECVDDGKVRKYILKDRLTDFSIAEFRYKTWIDFENCSSDIRVSDVVRY